MPKFSIIMPTFRREHVIGRAIETIRAQTFPDWELIVVDNAGSGYAFDDPRIRNYVFTERRGASQARNFGVGLARGDLTSFFDDDDIMYPRYLETFEKVFRNPRVMMARCGMLTGQDRKVVNFSFATPEVVVRTPFAKPQWEASECHDQKYFQGIAALNGWGKEEILEVPEILVEATSEARGGLRDEEGSL